ncbi:MAG: NAD(P)-dependent oxidoreductase, partial [Sandaracinaceae bacterium]
DGLGLRRPHLRARSSHALALAGLVERINRVLPTRREPRITRYTIGLLARTMTLDLTRAREDLAYAPKVDLDEGLARFLQAIGEGARRPS